MSVCVCYFNAWCISLQENTSNSSRIKDIKKKSFSTVTKVGILFTRDFFIVNLMQNISCLDFCLHCRFNWI